MTETTLEGRSARASGRRRLTAAMAGVALAALLAGCAGPSLDWPGAGTEMPTADPSEEIPVAYLPFYQQELTWAACEENPAMQCAVIDAPLDWDDPAAGTIELFLAKKVASGTEARRLGTLFYNPGGPGGSGADPILQDYLQVPADVLEAYDLVGFDPRGVSRSTPVKCFATDQEQDDYWFGKVGDYTPRPAYGTPE